MKAVIEFPDKESAINWYNSGSLPAIIHYVSKACTASFSPSIKRAATRMPSKLIKPRHKNFDSGIHYEKNNVHYSGH